MEDGNSKLSPTVMCPDTRVTHEEVKVIKWKGA